LNLCNGKAVELEVDDGASVVVEAGKPPLVDDVREQRMRVGCGSATIGMFAKQWFGKVDEVVVVDDHITGVLSEHQAGKLLGVPQTGIQMKAGDRLRAATFRWRTRNAWAARTLKILCRFSSLSTAGSPGPAFDC